MIQVHVGKTFIHDVLIDGGSGVNIIIENLIVQLGLSKLNSTPCNLHMVDQTTTKPLGLTRDMKIFVHGTPYTIIFIIIENDLDSTYSVATLALACDQGKGGVARLRA